MDRSPVESRVAPELLTIVDAAAALSCSPAHVRRCIKTGSIRVVRLGRAVRVPREEIRRFIQQLQREAARR